MITYLKKKISEAEEFKNRNLNSKNNENKKDDNDNSKNPYSKLVSSSKKDLENNNDDNDNENFESFVVVKCLKDFIQLNQILGLEKHKYYFLFSILFLLYFI